MGMPVVHFEIGNKNIARATAFHSELFERNIAKPDRGYAVVDTGSQLGIGGGLMESPGNVPSCVTVYVRVDDLDKYMVRAEELGGKKLMGPMEVGDMGAFALFEDPDGNVIGLFSEYPQE